MTPRTAASTILYPIIAFVLLALSFPIQAQRTTRRALRPIPPAQTATVATDTVFNPADSLLTLSGYTKPLKSRKESFFITNHSLSTIHTVGLTFEYYDTANRMLHSRDFSLSVNIPPGETRKVDTTSWDTQFTFYYHLTPPARPTTLCYPYSVVSKVAYVVY